MNIAHLLPYTARFPLKKHNGRYEWALRLAEAQSANGHTVAVYSAPDSIDRKGGLAWKSSAHDFKNKTLNNLANIGTALQDNSYDIYHSHFDYLQYFLADCTEKPILYTQHWFPNEDIAQAAHFNTSQNVLAVPPTNYMLEENNRLGILSAKTIHHGIDLNLFAPTNEPVGNRLIFVGRINPNKGVLKAVEIARATNQKLDIVGKVVSADEQYWQQILPLIDGEQIRYLGPKTHAEVALLLSRAKALVFPSQIQDAFGQVIIEAQACGTPVIISDTGASMELVDHGKSGFIARTESEFIMAIKNLGGIDRKYCRRFAGRFDADKMIKSYDQLYKKVINRSPS